MNQLHDFNLPSPVEAFQFPDKVCSQINLFIKRDDLIHPIISGNKWRKLKFNILFAKANKQNTILTFGGAFSNHIVATAFACKQFNLNCIVVVRGEYVDLNNPTLSKVREYGATIYKVSKTEYNLKTDEGYLQGLRERFGNFYLLPEGGANFYGVNGCQEIVTENYADFENVDYVVCSAGTGTTVAGILAASEGKFKTLCISPFKEGDFLQKDIAKLLNYSFFNENFTEECMQHLEINSDFNFGGFGKVKPHLVEFVQWLKQETNIQFDLVYNGKLMFGLHSLCKQGYFKPNAKIMIIHTGGVQGNEGFKK